MLQKLSCQPQGSRSTQRLLCRDQIVGDARSVRTEGKLGCEAYEIWVALDSKILLIHVRVCNHSFGLSNHVQDVGLAFVITVRT